MEKAKESKSEEFARGRWIKECSEEFDSIEIKEYPILDKIFKSSLK